MMISDSKVPVRTSHFLLLGTDLIAEKLVPMIAQCDPSLLSICRPVG